MLVSHAIRSGAHYFGVATLLGLALTASAAEASSITLTNAVGQWQNAILAPPDDVYDASTLVINNVAGNGTDVASWGESSSQGFNSSSYWFTPTADQPAIPVGTPFLLGTFMHLNSPIATNGITAIDYLLSFDITGGIPMPLDALIHFGHNETLNDPAVCPGSLNPCDDIVTTSLPGQTSFVLNGSETLYLHLLGFSNDGGTTFAHQFFSPEGGRNGAMLYGLVSSEPAPIPNPEPASMILLGSGLAAVAVQRYRARRR